nr:4-alpha-glucanotransferase [Microlunatus panaciterrae]
MSQEQREVAAAYGVATEYYDFHGTHVQVAEETITAVLAAMDVDVSSPAAAAAALRTRDEQRWVRMLPPCLVVQQGEHREIWVHVPAGAEVELWVGLENGGTRTGLTQIDRWVEPRLLADRMIGEATFELPADLPLGYHTLHARSAGMEASTTLAVTPPWLGLPPRLGERRTWGFAAQLYSVRSRGSWGVGDLTDLTDLSVWSASELGAGFVLVNPLHAAEPVAPMEPSPYLPSSRRFVNPLYLRVERIAEYVDLPPADRARVEQIAAETGRRLDELDAIDRNTSWTAKREALLLVHAVPRSAGREADFQGFLRREGQGLRDFATWSALAETYGNDFRSWPAELQDITSREVARFAEEHRQQIDLHLWLQWVTDEQLQNAQVKAVAAGMALGIMHDLAVGVHPGGADAWRLRHVYAQHVQVGAPPDAYSQVGQDWSQPPFRPDRLEELGYLPFRELLAAVLRHAGGVRVDHIIGLFRLWWIPAGGPASAGTYVRYDHEALIGILALEAYRAGAVVVGEDLGLVEPPVRDYLRSRGILGTSILWFELDDLGRPRPADEWRELCLASVTTHDLPPTAGYLAGDHIRLRHQLGRLAASLEVELAADEAERAAWLAEVHSRGLLPADASVEETVLALHRYLRLSPARLLCVSLADAVGDRRTQNQPGTTDEYPNWRVPLSGPDGTPLRLEDVFASTRVSALVESVRTP